MPSGPWDQSQVEGRPDTISFTSPPLANCFQMIGWIKANLWVMSNCTDTDLTAKLTDVYPDGRSIWLADGILRMRVRNGLDTAPSFMTANTPYNISIDMGATGYYWETGHRIRITISSSNYPAYGVNPNMGTAAGVAPNYIIAPINGLYPKPSQLQQGVSCYCANNTILMGANYPSCIILPVTSS